MQLKPIAEQVIVVTGAGSGLGLAIARKAALAGAAVALADPDDAAVRKASEALNAAGGRTYPIGGDASSEAGCERIGRAAVARFDRVDSWIDATGTAAGVAYAAEGLVRHMVSRGGQGAVVAFAKRLPRAAASELRRGRGVLAATLIALPREVRSDAPHEAAAAAALYALAHPMGRMAVAARGRRLTALTQASKHRGLLIGVGLVAVAGAAVWLNRGRIASAARPLALARVRGRQLRAAKLAAKPPGRTARLVRRFR